MPDFSCSCFLWFVALPILILGAIMGIRSGLSRSPSQWTGRGSSGPGPMYYMRDDD